MRMCLARFIPLLLLPLLQPAPASAGPGDSPEPVATQAYETRTVRVPGTTVSFELVRCPAPPVLTDADAEAVDPTTVVTGLWTLRTEVPWELYDIYVYHLDHPHNGVESKLGDEAENQAADAIARPSKPYVPPDRGFGHQGYPAMGMTRRAAEGFCAWLSNSIGIAFRLPTSSEWTHLANAGSIEQHPPTPEIAWTAANAGGSTHAIGTKAANGFGLFDTLGNVAEWVQADTRRPAAMGGSYRDAPADCRPDALVQQDRTWNESDPQIPKSEWWLADCSWVGFRFVTEQDIAPEQADED